MTVTYSYSDIAKMIDHSLLNPALTCPNSKPDAGWCCVMTFETILNRIQDLTGFVYEEVLALFSHLSSARWWSCVRWAAPPL